MITNILKYTLVFALFSIGFLALMVAGGDVDPNNPMSFTKEMTTRAVALCITGGCIKVGQWCGKKGLLPDEFCEDPDKEEMED
ncbi:MAG: hypothetical protein NC418_04595 [Muribaculaceae bacterium]|nr:hypothetical protein [Muribaculaceae bacterium]